MERRAESYTARNMGKGSSADDDIDFTAMQRTSSFTLPERETFITRQPTNSEKALKQKPKEPITGHLEVQVIQAAGRAPVMHWPSAFWPPGNKGDGDKANPQGQVQQELMAFCKVELRGKRGGSQKTRTKSTRFNGMSLMWNELILLDVYPDSDELRLMLCLDRGKFKEAKAFANGGFFMRDIFKLGAVRGEWFDMFSPGGSGGSIQLTLIYTPVKNIAPTAGLPPGIEDEDDVDPLTEDNTPLSPKPSNINGFVEVPQMQSWKFQL
eukprot:jgi/Mesvir1/27015/Mv20722-RA.1